MLGLDRAYWIVAAAVLVLHQGLDWNRSLQRGIERVIGTLLGLTLAGLVLWLDPQGPWLAATLAVLQFLIWMLVARNYALAVIFITAAAITMASGGQAVENIPGLLWTRAIDTIIGCTIGIGVLMVTAPRMVAVPIPQELAAALRSAQKLLKFVATGDVVSTAAKRARRNLRYRAMALLTAYELGAGSRQHRDFAEALWPAVVAAQRLLYRLHAFCWALEEAGSNGAEEVAFTVFGDNGLVRLNATLEDFAKAITFGRSVPISSDVPAFLKDDLEDLSRSLAAAGVGEVQEIGVVSRARNIDLRQRSHGNFVTHLTRDVVETRMSDETTNAIEAGIRSAFTTYYREDDPDWRSASWIKPDECSHLARSILKELAARGFEIVKKA